MAKAKETKKEVVEIQLTKILPDPNNTRSQINKVADNELAQSIRSKGVVQPIGLRPCTDQKGFEYYVIFGHRRLRASKIAGLKSIPAVIIDVTIEDAKDLQLLENLHRLDPHPMDEAIAFHEMNNSKKCSFSDIAKTFGKSEYYIKQRIKLIDLSERFQKLFLAGKIDLLTALRIATKSLEIQEAIWNDQVKTEKWEEEDYQFSFRYERRYEAVLDDAKFDINDKKLIPSAGACTSCQFNSNVSKLFANEDVKAICNNYECFYKKNEVGFKKNLQLAIEDPGCVLIAHSYNCDKASLDFIKTIDGVLMDGFSVEPEPECNDREWYNGDNETEEEDEAEYQEALAEYNKEMKEYKKAIETGEYVKAFYMGGNAKGEFTYVSLYKSSKKINSSNSDGNNENESNSSDAIEDEIERLESKEKRSKEIDENKIWSALKPAFEPKDFAYNGDELTTIERKAAAKTIYNKLGYYARNSFRDKFKVEGDEIIDISEVALNSLLRFFFVNELPPAELYNGYSTDAKICLELANEYFPDKLSLAQLEQNDITNIRVAKVEKRIADLKSKL
jgi:ParB family transcriptional regulator, chromosome partitioning protein